MVLACGCVAHAVGQTHIPWIVYRHRPNFRASPIAQIARLGGLFLCLLSSGIAVSGCAV